MNLYIFNFKKINKYIIYAIFFLILLFVFDRIFYFTIREAMFSFYAKNLNDRQIKKRLNINNKIYYDTLIMGSSRTREGIHPYYLHKYLGLKSYNAAWAGRFPQYHYNFYKKFKEQNGIPRNIIYGFDYFTFAKDSSETQLMYVKRNVNIKTEKINILDLSNKSSIILSKISYLYRAKPKIDQFLIDWIDSYKKNILDNSDSTSKYLSAYKGKSGVVPLKHRMKPEYWKKSKYPPFPGKEGEFLSKLLQELENDAVYVVFVLLPDYISVYKTNYQHKKYYNQLKIIASQYSNIKVLDYNHNKTINIFNPEYFTDGKYGSRNSHLSFFGAKIFNKILCYDMKNFIIKIND